MEFILFTEQIDKVNAAKEILDRRIHRQYDSYLSVSQKQFLDFINLQSQIHQIAVANHDNRIVGWAMSIPHNHYLEIQTYVEPPFRRQGIGTQLLKLLDFDFNSHDFQLSANPKFWNSFRKSIPAKTIRK